MKIKKKLIVCLLTLSLISQFSPFALAGKKLDPNKTYFQISRTYEITNNDKNKKTTKYYIHFYIVMKKLFAKYKIPEKYLESICKSNDHKNLVKNNKQYLVKENFFEIYKKENKNFKNLIKNYKNDLKNLTITKKDFEDAKKNIIKYQKDYYIAAYEKSTKNMEKKYDFNLNDNVNFIEIGKIIEKENIKNQQNELKKAIKNDDKDKIKLAKKYIKKFEKNLKNTKKLKENGRMIYKNYRIEKKQILELKSFIKEIQDVKFEEITNLTKNIVKIEDNIKS